MSGIAFTDVVGMLWNTHCVSFTKGSLIWERKLYFAVSVTILFMMVARF